MDNLTQPARERAEYYERRAYDDWVRNLDPSKTYAVVGADYLEARALASHICQVRAADVERFWASTQRIITKQRGAISFFAASQVAQLRGLWVDGVWASQRAEREASRELAYILYAIVKPEVRAESLSKRGA